MATDYAIVETGGKQYRVEEGDSFVVDRLAEDEGAKVSLRAVMFRGESDVVLVPSELEKVKVEAKVAAHERGPKIKVSTYKAKKGYRRTKGHRSELTRLEVTDVKLLSRRPAKPTEKADAEEPVADAPTKAKPKPAGDTTTKAKPKAPAKPAKAAAAAAANAGSGEDAVAKPAGKAEQAKAKPAAKAAAKPKKVAAPKTGAVETGAAETAGAKPAASKAEGELTDTSKAEPDDKAKGDAKPAAKRKTASPKKES